MLWKRLDKDKAIVVVLKLLQFTFGSEWLVKVTTYMPGV